MEYELLWSKEIIRGQLVTGIPYLQSLRALYTKDLADLYLASFTYEKWVTEELKQQILALIKKRNSSIIFWSAMLGQYKGEELDAICLAKIEAKVVTLNKSISGEWLSVLANEALSIDLRKEILNRLLEKSPADLVERVIRGRSHEEWFMPVLFEVAYNAVPVERAVDLLKLPLKRDQRDRVYTKLRDIQYPLNDEQLSNMTLYCDRGTENWKWAVRQLCCHYASLPDKQEALAKLDDLRGQTLEREHCWEEDSELRQLIESKSLKIAMAKEIKCINMNRMGDWYSWSSRADKVSMHLRISALRFNKARAEGLWQEAVDIAQYTFQYGFDHMPKLYNKAKSVAMEMMLSTASLEELWKFLNSNTEYSNPFRREAVKLFIKIADLALLVEAWLKLKAEEEVLVVKKRVEELVTAGSTKLSAEDWESIAKQSINRHPEKPELFAFAFQQLTALRGA